MGFRLHWPVRPHSPVASAQRAEMYKYSCNPLPLLCSKLFLRYVLPSESWTLDPLSIGGALPALNVCLSDWE